MMKDKHHEAWMKSFGLVLGPTLLRVLRKMRLKQATQRLTWLEHLVAGCLPINTQEACPQWVLQ